MAPDSLWVRYREYIKEVVGPARFVVEKFVNIGDKDLSGGTVAYKDQSGEFLKRVIKA